MSTLIKRSNIRDSVLYQLKNQNVFIISNQRTRKLLCEPEIIGYTIPELIKEPITDMLSRLKAENIFSVNVLNILRGGLNFPIEEACSLSSIEVKGVSFITSERFFLDKKVSRIETRYRKINPISNSSIIIGDIIASGETLKNALSYIEETYAVSNAVLRNIIIFTIGTDSVLQLIDEFERQLKKRWPTFDKIIVCYFEGIFNTYDSFGITGLNLPKVDFCINNATIAPEFRNAIMKKPTTVFEKCIIYDGGARRFEQSSHVKQLLSYWEQLNLKASTIDTREFLEEKYGYTSSISYKDWKNINGYSDLSDEEMLTLYKREIVFQNNIEKSVFKEWSMSRYKELKNRFANWL